MSAIAKSDPRWPDFRDVGWQMTSVAEGGPFKDDGVTPQQTIIEKVNALGSRGWEPFAVVGGRGDSPVTVYLRRKLVKNLEASSTI